MQQGHYTPIYSHHPHGRGPPLSYGDSCYEFPAPRLLGHTRASSGQAQGAVFILVHPPMLRFAGLVQHQHQTGMFALSHATA